MTEKQATSGRRPGLAELDSAIEQVLAEQTEVWERMAHLSHKINNPLTSLIGRAQLLRNRQGNDDYVRHAESVLERERIPGGYRYYVRRYFQLIRPRERGAIDEAQEP